VPVTISTTFCVELCLSPATPRPASRLALEPRAECSAFADLAPVVRFSPHIARSMHGRLRWVWDGKKDAKESAG